MFNTYAVQNAKPSGETFVVEYDADNEAVAICGPLTTEEREQAIRDVADAASFEFEPIEPGSWEWGFPVATWDPNTDEVWRA